MACFVWPPSTGGAARQRKPTQGISMTSIVTTYVNSNRAIYVLQIPANIMPAFMQGFRQVSGGLKAWLAKLKARDAL